MSKRRWRYPAPKSFSFIFYKKKRYRFSFGILPKINLPAHLPLSAFKRF